MMSFIQNDNNQNGVLSKTGLGENELA